MKKLYIATSNKHKSQEIGAMLVDKNIVIRDLKDCPGYVAPEESGKTFLENARIKARALRGFLQQPASTGGRAGPPLHQSSYILADDSGLECDALDGAPGVYSARFAGEGASDKDNNKKLIAMLRGISEKNGRTPSAPTARFVCALVLIAPDGTETNVIESCEGHIIFEPRGEHGFGYDPYFFLEEFGKTMAELNPDEKNRISHRGKALRKLISLF